MLSGHGRREIELKSVLVYYYSPSFSLALLAVEWELEFRRVLTSSFDASGNGRCPPAHVPDILTRSMRTIGRSVGRSVGRA